MLPIFLFLMNSIESYSAPIPTRFRWEANIGKAWSKFSETRNSVIAPDKKIDQESYFTDFKGTYIIIPKYFDINAGATYIGLAHQSPANPKDQFVYQYFFANAGLNIPFSDFFWLRLVAETFYSTMITPNGTFGFRNLGGSQFYPTFEYFPFETEFFTSISPFIKFPIVSTGTVWKEWVYGLKFRFPVVRGEPKFPLFAYQQAFVVRFSYNKLELNITQPGFLPYEAEHSWFGVSIGYEW